MLVRHFMSRNVFTIAPDCSCSEILRAMQQRHIRRAPVVHGHDLVGIVTLHDLWRILPGTVGQAETEAGRKMLDLPVANVMTRNIKTLDPADHLETAAQLMLKHKIGGVPVVHADELVGIITESDVFRAVWSVLSSGRGARVILEEPSTPLDYAALALSHRCQLHTLMRFAQPDGGATMGYLRAEGEGVKSLVEELWQKAARVLSVEGDARDDRS